jgi:acyl-CoA thioesterase FadM
MTRLLKLGLALVIAFFRAKLTLQETSETYFRVWPTDVDVSIMNHASAMTVMEAGRIDYMVRTGFFTVAMSQKWYFPLGSISVVFHRPLKVFQKANVKTKVIYVDENWIYLQHQIIRMEKEHVSAIVKCAVKHGKERVPYQDIAARLALGKIPSDKPEIISLIESEKSLFEKHFAI